MSTKDSGTVGRLKNYRPGYNRVHTIALLLYHGELRNEKNSNICPCFDRLDGQEIPIYRFAGGDCCEDPFAEGIKILEW